MKKLLVLMLSLAMIVSLASCGSRNSAETEPAAEAAAPAESAPQTEQGLTMETEPKALIVYFSWSGNTEAVAKEIQAQTGAELFEITPAEAYTDDYNNLLDIAREEQRTAARPAIADTVENFEAYDIIYFGYPNWWGDMPMIMYSFLDEYDFSGKTIVPFVTSGGSGFSGTISTIKEMEPEAEVLDGLSLGSAAAANPGGDVSEWLANNGIS